MSRILTRKAAKVTYCLQIKNCHCMKAAHSLVIIFFSICHEIAILYLLKLRRSRKQIMVSSNLPRNRTNCSRIKETINCFPDLLTFTAFEKQVWTQNREDQSLQTTYSCAKFCCSLGYKSSNFGYLHMYLALCWAVNSLSQIGKTLFYKVPYTG